MAFVVLVITFAFLGILGGSNVLYVLGTLVLLFAVVSLLVVTYLRDAKEVSPASTVELPDKDLKAATEKLAKATTSNHGQDYIVDYFQWLADRIQNRATLIASQQGRDMETRDLAQACSELAPGDPFPQEQSLGQRITSSITGITLVSAILAIVFGAIGFAVLRWGGTQGADSVKTFIDIAQIFAGAVVGSTGAAAISSR